MNMHPSRDPEFVGLVDHLLVNTTVNITAAMCDELGGGIGKPHVVGTASELFGLLDGSDQCWSVSFDGPRAAGFVIRPEVGATVVDYFLDYAPELDPLDPISEFYSARQ